MEHESRATSGGADTSPDLSCLRSLCGSFPCPPAATHPLALCTKSRELGPGLPFLPQGTARTYGLGRRGRTAFVSVRAEKVQLKPRPQPGAPQTRGGPGSVSNRGQGRGQWGHRSISNRVCGQIRVPVHLVNTHKHAHALSLPVSFSHTLKQANLQPIQTRKNK